MYSSCLLCEHRCGVDRTRGPAGLCGAADRPRVFCELVEYAEEPDLSPAFSVSLSGCNLTCPFCITGPESQDASAGRPVSAEALADRARAAVRAGARSIYLLGGEPTIFLPFALDFAHRLRDASVPRVLKTNLFCTEPALALALDAFDVIVADFKFGNDACARRLGAFPGYVDVLRRNLALAAARRRTVVRHLLMPGHVDCCWRPIAAWVRRELPAAELALRDHYLPAFRAAAVPGLARTTTGEEASAAFALLENSR